MARGKAMVMETEANEYPTPDAGLNGGNGNSGSGTDVNALLANLDFSVEIGKPRFSEIPAGEYPVTLLSVKLESTKDGKPRVNWEMQIDGDTEFNGRKLRDGANVAQNTFGFIERNARAFGGEAWDAFVQEVKASGQAPKPNQVIGWILENILPGAQAVVVVGPPNKSQNPENTYPTVKNVKAA